MNQVSYAEATRAETFFLGLATTWQEMYQQAGSLVASSTQQVARPRYVAAREAMRPYPGLSAVLAVIARRLLHESEKRRRGKRYDRLIWVYFADLVAVLEHLLLSLKPAGSAAWVIGDSAPYGVYVDTPGLIGLAADEVGFELVDDFVLRERGARWPAAGGSRHRRRLTERLIVFRRPSGPEQLPLFAY